MEKRREKRRAEENRVTLEVSSEGGRETGKKVCHAMTRDLSMGGMRISCGTFYPVNTPLKIRLRLGRSQKLIRLMGTIRWIRSLYENELFDFGLKFEDLSPEVSMALIEHLYGQAAG
jgi:c-di-GMP-binding flagellar brake protein YcgR